MLAWLRPRWDVRPDAKTVTVQGLPGGTATRAVGEVLSSADAGFREMGFELPVGQLFFVADSAQATPTSRQEWVSMLLLNQRCERSRMERA